MEYSQDEVYAEIEAAYEAATDKHDLFGTVEQVSSFFPDAPDAMQLTAPTTDGCITFEATPVPATERDYDTGRESAEARLKGYELTGADAATVDMYDVMLDARHSYSAGNGVQHTDSGMMRNIAAEADEIMAAFDTLYDRMEL